MIVKNKLLAIMMILIIGIATLGCASEKKEEVVLPEQQETVEESEAHEEQKEEVDLKAAIESGEIYNMYPFTVTGEKSQGDVNFTINNDSQYDFFSIYFGPSDESYEDIDILPHTLAAGESFVYDDTLIQPVWDKTQWTIYVLDVQGDPSAKFLVFNPWALESVSINWNNADGGYICEFNYDEEQKMEK